MAVLEDQDRIWHYYIDADGHLWHEGAEFDDPAVLTLFMKNMTKLPTPKGDERYHVYCQGEECLITAEDVPYVVQDVEFLSNEVRLKFPGKYSEALDPKTLFVGKLNVLYCSVRGGEFTARFNRKSYLDFAKHVNFDPVSKTFYLVVDNNKYTIQGAQE